MATIDLKGVGFTLPRLLRPIGRFIAQRVAAGPRRLLGRAGRRIGVLAPDLLAVEFLLATIVFLFRDALQEGIVFHEADTSTMFYPIFAAYAGALGRGEILLWSPHLFSGFPLLAEGQTGVLYPLNWLAATLLPAREGFIWLRVVHYALAALFAYLFGRSLRLAPGPSAILALSFSLGSFMVGQMQHGSVVASAIWLPLILALTELALRADGRARLRYLLLAGPAMGMSALGVHMQPVVLSGGCFLAWVLFRIVVPAQRQYSDGSGPRVTLSRERARTWQAVRARSFARGGLPAAGRSWAVPAAFEWLDSFSALGRALWHSSLALSGRVGVAVCAMVLVPAFSIALSAAQLLPLYELSGHSGRSDTWSYEAATDYSLPLPNLVTLVFPFFFRDGQGGGWSLWQPWEVTYYAGIVPLALAALALLSARRRELLFFVPLVVISTLLALGDYSPLRLYEHVWTWPGINLQRAPARFSYLGVLGFAALAGFGAQVLWDHLRAWPGGARRSLRPLLVWIVALVATVAGIVWHLVSWRAWLQSEPLLALAYLDEHYLSQRRDPGVVETVQQVYSGLWYSLDLGNPHTALPLLLLATLLVLVVGWNELRRARPIWQGLLVVLVAVDLLSFANEYHPRISIDEIADVGESGRFLSQQRGLFRIYTHPDVEEPKANELLPWEISELRAYDPLELGRHRVLLGAATYVDNWVLDLLGVRYRLLPTNQPGLPSYRQTAFHPQHPLVSGTAVNPSGYEAWAVPTDPADELRVVSVLEDAFGIADGEVVGEWVLTDAGGRETTFRMQAGRDTAEWTYDDPLTAVPPAHARARVAFTFDLPGPLPNGARHVHLFYTSFALPDRPRITRAEFRHIHPVGRMQIFGFGFFDKEHGLVGQFYDREKYRQAFSAPGVLVQENRAAFPRAFAVPEAVSVRSPEEAGELLSHGPLRPRRQVVLENLEASPPAPSLTANLARDDRLGAPYGQVEVVDYGDDAVSVRAETDGGYLVLTDAYYPGWRAYVDGEETRLLRADYLFRAVSLPPGRHLVQFRYQPESFEIGLMISKLALTVFALGLLVTFAPPGRLRRPTWLRTP